MGWLICQVPASVAYLDYVVLGSERAPQCQATNGTDVPVFELSVEECNVSQRVRNSGSVKDLTATLVPRARAQGLIISGHYVFVCTCQVALQHTVGTQGVQGMERDDEFITEIELDGTGAFDAATMTAYGDPAFREPIPEGGALPSTETSFYYEVQVNGTDAIGLLDCAASPSGDVEDPRRHVFLQDSCPVGWLNFETLPRPSSNMVRFSTLPFKFDGVSVVFLTCTVMRCASEPCGACDTARRLRSTTAAVGDAKSTTASGVVTVVTITPGMVILPTSDSLALPVYSGEHETTPFASVIAVNLTLYWCPVFEDMRSFTQIVADMAATWLDLPLASVRAVGAYMRGATQGGRILGWAEFNIATALTVQLEFGVASADLAQTAESVEVAFMKGSPEFTSMLRAELESSANATFPHLRAGWGAIRLTDYSAQPKALVESPPDGASATTANIQTVVVPVLAALLIISVCACVGLRQCCAGKRTGKQEETAPPEAGEMPRDEIVEI